MENNFHRIISNLIKTNNGSLPHCTTKEEMLNCIQATMNFTIYMNPTKNPVAINNYYSLWKNNYSHLQYDELPCFMDEIFQWEFEYPFLSYPLYSIFNLYFILKDSDMLIKTSLKKFGFHNLTTSSRLRTSFRPVDPNNPILACGTIGKQAVLVDGNNRIQNATMQNSDIPLLILPYERINKKHFINEFNFAVFIYIVEINSIIANFDTLRVDQSIRRIKQFLYS